MLYHILILMLSIPIAYLIAFKTRDEFKEGKKYFILLILLSLIILTILTFSISNILFLLIGIIIAYLIKKPYLSLGFTLLSSFQQNKELLIASLIFITSLPLSTLYFNKKNKIRNLIINPILLTIPSILIFTKFNFQSLTTGLLIGAILSLIKNAISNKSWFK